MQLQIETEANLPTVERAADVAVDDSAPNRQIGAKMRTKCVKQRWLTLLCAKEDELTAEDPHGHHL